MNERQRRALEREITRNEKRIEIADKRLALRNKRRTQRANGAKYPWQRSQ